MKAMRMTKVGRLGARLALLSLCTVALSAGPMMAQGRGMGLGMGGDPQKMEDRQLQVMTKQVKLTPDQVTQVKSVFAASDEQLKALRDDTSTAQADKRSKMMSLMQDRQAKVRAVMTDEQKPKLDALQEKMREKRAERKGQNAVGSSGGNAAPQ